MWFIVANGEFISFIVDSPLFEGMELYEAVSNEVTTKKDFNKEETFPHFSKSRDFFT